MMRERITAAVERCRAWMRESVIVRRGRITIVNVCRLIVAVTFILSGFVKAVDPLGTQYKITDYVAAVGIDGLLPSWLTLTMSILLSTIEFCLGIMLLLAVRKRLTTILTLLFIGSMTVVTLWLVVAQPVSDCGCFGDAIHLTNGQTFVKNILLLLATIIVTLWPHDMLRFLSDNNASIAANYSILFIIVIALYSLYYLPIFDFRPYRIGADIPSLMSIPDDAEQPIYETTFLLEKDGVTKEFDLAHYPDSSWTFIDSKTTLVKEGYVPPIHDFFITDSDGEDYTDDILESDTYTFLLIAPYLSAADDSNFGTIEQIYEYAQDYGYRFLCLTASDDDAIRQWQENTGAEYPFLFSDGTTLKTIIRSNPGLVLLYNGIVINKWSHNGLPSVDSLTAPIDTLSLSHPHTTAMRKVVTLLLLFILPIILLSVADRLWAWRKRKR